MIFLESLYLQHYIQVKRIFILGSNLKNFQKDATIKCIPSREKLYNSNILFVFNQQP